MQCTPQTHSQRAREPSAGEEGEAKMGVEIGGCFNTENVLLLLHLLAKLRALHGFYVNLSVILLPKILISEKERTLALLHLSHLN